MADKRMFSKSIVLSDAFLDMPMSSRCLYFTLGMFGDDDGFVNSPKGIMRQIGATEDDLKILITKKFILPFESGVIVIKHWRINNYLRSDRYKETTYTEEKSQLEIEENGAYTLKKDDWYTAGIPTGIPSIDKNSIDKNSIDIPSFQTPIEELFLQFWKAYPKKVGKQDALKSFKKIKPTRELVEQMVSVINDAKNTEQWTKNGGQYIPNPSTWLNQGRWEDDISTYTYKQSAEGRKVDTGRFSEIPY